MSQRFRKELRDKYSSAFLFLCFVGGCIALAADEIGELDPAARSGAWTRFGLASVVVAVLSFVALWRTTPWHEVPAEQRKLNWTTVAGVIAIGGVSDFLLQDNATLILLAMAFGAGFFAAVSLTFLLVGVLRRWRSDDPAHAPASE